MATTRVILDLQTDLKQPNSPSAGDDVANRDYVDTVAGGTPDATSAPGGGTKGIATFDENFGVEVVGAGVVRTKVDTTRGMTFNVGGDLQTRVSTVEGLEYNVGGEQRVKLPSPVQGVGFDGGGAVEAKVDPTKGVEVDVAGGTIQAKVDGSTIGFNGSGELESLVTGAADATSAPGGGTKGIATYDEDKGLQITGGASAIAEVKVDADSINFDATGNLEAIGCVRRLSTVTGIDLTTTGTNALYTVPAGRTAFILSVVLQPTAITGPVGDAEVGVGIAVGEDDIVPQTVLAGMTDLDTAHRLGVGPDANFRIADAGEIVRLGRDVPDTGTQLVVSAHVVGFLI